MSISVPSQKAWRSSFLPNQRSRTPRQSVRAAPHAAYDASVTVFVKEIANLTHAWDVVDGRRAESFCNNATRSIKPTRENGDRRQTAYGTVSVQAAVTVKSKERVPTVSV